MQIITFSAIKGGVGKTTLTYTLCNYLMTLNKKILLIDMDHQCNLTSLFTELKNKNTIAEIFKEESDSVDIIKINNNIDIIPGNINLDDIEDDIKTRTGKEMLLFLYIKKCYSTLSKYDYILIDTHPDFTTITKNAIAVSDYVLSPITPSEHGYEAKFNLEARFNKYSKELIDYKTGESLITAKLFFIANMVKHNTKSSSELIEKIKDDKEVIAIIPNKELFNKSTLEKLSIFDMKNNNEILYKNREFFYTIDQEFDKINKVINN